MNKKRLSEELDEETLRLIIHRLARKAREANEAKKIEAEESGYCCVCSSAMNPQPWPHKAGGCTVCDVCKALGMKPSGTSFWDLFD